MSSKGLAALRSAHKGEARSAYGQEAIQLVAAAAAAAGIKLPDTWAKLDGRMIRIEFSGAYSLQLRTDAGEFGTWSLWFGGTRVGLFTSPGPALAEAKRRGWLRPPP